MAAPRSSRRRAAVARLVSAAVAAVVSVGVAPGCSSDGERATTTSTTTPPTPGDLARRACTEVLDERSELVSRRASEANQLLREVLEAPDPPDDPMVDELRDALGAERGQLADAQDLLRDVAVPVEDLPDWSTIVESVDPVLADLDETLLFLRSPDWERVPSSIGQGAPTPDRVALDDALGRLDLLGTDCEWVFDYPGDPTDAAPFHHDAAAACTVAVERRRDDGFAGATASDAERSAERAATDEDLAAVDAGTLDDPEAWDRLVAAIGDLTAGGTDEATERRVADGLEALGLDQRPCAALGR